MPHVTYLGSHLDYSLIYQNQLQYNGIIVNDVPRHLSPDPKVATHFICVLDMEICIPLKLSGIISYFVSRTPTAQELDDC
jgi:hypothetical protein